VSFTTDDIAGVLDLINNHSNQLSTIGLSSRALASLLKGKPFATINDVAAASNVGSTALKTLRDCVRRIVEA